MIPIRVETIAGSAATIVLVGILSWTWWLKPERLTNEQLEVRIVENVRNAEAYLELATRMEKEQKYAPAMINYVGAAKAGIGPTAYAKAARCAFLAGQLELAHQYALDAVDLDGPSPVKVASTIASVVLLELGDPAAALKILPVGVAAVPFETDYVRARILLTQQRYAEAVVFARLAALEPTSQRMSIWARALRLSGDIAGAEELISEYRDSSDAPLDWLLESGITRVSTAAGRTEQREAGEVLLRKVITESKSASQCLEATLTLAQSVSISGRSQDIPLILSVAKRQFPKDDAVSYLYAQALLRSGRVAEGKTLLMRSASKQLAKIRIEQSIMRDHDQIQN